MTRERSVLDRNLERLLVRAYVPALPRPELRRAALELARDEAGRRARGPRGRLLRLVLPAAAAAAAALLAWTLLRGGPDPSGAPDAPLSGAAELVARGEVAVRAGSDGAWRPATADERARGVLLGSADALALETPESAGATLLAAGARVVLEPEGALEARREGERVRVRLLRGAARAWPASGGPVALAPGAWVEVAAPPLAAGPEPEAEARRAVAPPEPPEAAREAFEGAGFALRVAGPDGAPVERFRAFALPVREVPDVAIPKMRDAEAPGGLLEWDGLPPDVYRLYVEADGFAQHQSDAIELGADQRVELEIRLARGGRVRGFVVEDAGSAPVAGATAVVESEVPAQYLPFDLEDEAEWIRAVATSGPDGAFTLEHVRAGSARIRVDAPGLGPRWATVEVPEGGAAGDLLVRLPAGGSVEGVVADEAGRPIAGAVVLATFADDPRAARLFSFREAETGADGRYRADELAAGFHMLVMFPSRAAMDSGAMPELRPALVSSGGVARVDFRADPGRPRLSGRVLDAAGRPVGFQKLSFLPVASHELDGAEDWLASASDADGRYAIELDRAGPHSVFAALGMGEKLTWIASVDVPAGVLEVERDLVLEDTALSARVVRADDGRPVLHATAIVLRLDETGGRAFAGRALTDGDGRAEFQGLLPGRYLVVGSPVDADLGFEAAGPVELAPGRPVDLQVALPQGGVLRVRVVDATGSPVEGARIDVHAPDGRRIETAFDVRTDARGEASFPGLAPGLYRAVAERDGLAPASAAAEVRPVVGAELVLTLR